MAMKQCPDCGEKYSDTYKRCPFCEEEEALREGKRRKGGRRAAHGRQFSILTPTLVVLILIMSALLVYLIKGDDLFSSRVNDGTGLPDGSTLQQDTDEKGDDPDGSGVEDTGDDQMPDAGDLTGEGENGVMPGGSDEEDETPSDSSGMTYEKAAALPAGLTLSTTDFTLRMVGESATITASGGSGSYQWFSQDEGVASVSVDGKVTAISRGTINVVATDGEKQGTCIVRVNVSGGASTTTAPTDTSGSYTLNREDMTLSVGESFQLQLSGATGVTWSIADSGVAAISSSGTVTAVAAGTTTATATVNGKSVSCIVRVK